MMNPVTAFDIPMFTPLMAACSTTSNSEETTLALVKKLIESGANVNATDADGITALMLACQVGYVSVVQELLAHVANVNQADVNGYNALFWAIIKNFRQICSLLIEKKFNVALCSIANNTEEKVLAIVKILIQHDADINATDKKGITALMLSCEVGYVSVVDELLSHQSSYQVHQADEEGQNALFWAIKESHFNHCALLVEKNCVVAPCPTTNNTEETVLALVKILLKHGANVNTSDSQGITALMLACQLGHLSVIQELIAHGAEVNKTDIQGHSALFWAINENQYQVCVMLIEKKSDINAVDIRGTTCYQLAASKGFVDILYLLESCAEGRKLNPYRIEASCVVEEMGWRNSVLGAKWCAAEEPPYFTYLIYTNKIAKK